MGYSVVMNESILAVMAPGAIDGDTAYPEAIFVYVKEGEQWEYGFALENPGGENGWIGSSPLVLLDNYLFAGVPVWGPIDSDTGAVVVYDLSLGIPVDVLEAPSGQGNTGYGSTLAGWGNRIAVGAYKESVPNGSTGVVYLYEYVNGAWTVETKISPSGESPYTYFGSSLAMTGNGYLAVSDLAGNGTVRMFKEDETGKWGQAGEPLEEKLFPGENQDNFGHRLAGGQDTLAVISHPKKYDGFEKVHNIPRAHLYTLEDGIWKWLLTTPAEAYWHPFNYADGRVALNENFLVVGDLDNYMFPRAYSWESIGPACTVVDPSACLCSEGWTGVDCGTPE